MARERNPAHTSKRAAGAGADRLAAPRSEPARADGIGQAGAASSSPEQRYAQLLGGIEAIVWEADAATLEFVFVSEHAGRLLGCSAQSWLEQRGFWRDHLHPDDRERVVECCAAAALDQQVHDFEYRMIAAGGRIVPLRSIVTPVVDAGTVVRLRGITVESPKHDGREDSDRNSDESYRLIVENLNDVVYATDRTGVLTYISSAVERMSSYTREEMLGKPFAAFVHPDDIAALTSSFIALFAGIYQPSEFRVLDKNGDVHWVRSSSRLTQEKGEVSGVAGVFVDITARKHAEEALRESEARYRDLVELSPDGIAIHCEGKLVFANNAGARLLGAQDASELLDRPIMDFVHPDSRAAVATRVLHVLTEGGHAERMEEKFLRLDGSAIDVEVASMPLTYQGKAAAQVIVHDVGERNRANEALRVGAKRYRDLLENSHDLIYFHDLDGNLKAFNRAAEKATGYTRQEAAGVLNLNSLVAPEHLPFVHKVLRGLREGMAPPMSYEIDIIAKDGRRIALEVVSRVVRHDGQAVGMQGIARDVTERKRAQAEVNRLNEELEQRVRDRTARLETATKEMEAFSYSVSHDLRSPLRVIEGFSHLFLEEYGSQLDAQGRHYIERVKATGSRMGELISDLLALSRVARSALRRGRCDLSAFARSVAAELRQAAPDRDVTFEIAGGVVAEGDASLVRIVMHNLLENAWKYTGRQPRACIEFGVGVVDGERFYFVRDDGAGFDPRYAGRLFGAFQRLHPASEFEGTGIGLATVQRIVQRHGGRVWAEGAVGEGAKFCFTLPPRNWSV